MIELPDKKPVRPRRRWLVGLYLALVAAGIFAAWQAHVLWLSRGLSSRTQRPNFTERQRLQVKLPPNVRSPADPILPDPLQESGLTEFTSDPGGVHPPAGAKRGLSRQVRADGKDYLHAGYEYRGDLAAAVRHYETAAAARGFRHVDDRIGRLGWRRIFLVKDRMHLIVALRKAGKKDKIVTIVVTLIRPAQERDGPKGTANGG